ncbi:MAG TPA: radical SAM protein [Verrucomicrobiota bacterium]|nr:radical SAM protein [Verrucomicrobiota bacterium]
MSFFLHRSELRDLYDKVAAGERISEADALRLFESKDLNALGAIADLARQRKVGDRASYIVNRYLNYSNYCILSCQFCAFQRKKRDKDGFELSIPQMVEKAREALRLGITELHIVGGLHPSLPFSYYTDMLKALSALNDELVGRASPRADGKAEGGASGASPRRLQLKCFTANEILHLAWLGKRSTKETLMELREAGLDSLTGGGAEIFRQEVRSAIAKGKESAAEWLEVHRTWHQLGGRSTCTMLYGHVESLADRVDHLRQLRELQDEARANGFGHIQGPLTRPPATLSPSDGERDGVRGSSEANSAKQSQARAPYGGFVGFVPLAYMPQDNDIPVEHAPTAFDSLRTIAVSRIYLDNFDHITAYWVGLGMKLAQVALSYGADDLHGTIIEEHIFHMAGATSPQLQTEADMLKAIREAGRTPVQRNTFYEPIRVLERASVADEAEPPSGKSKVLADNLATA